METLNFNYVNVFTITLAALGMLIHMLMFVTNKTKGKNDFSFSIWLQDKMNWVRLVLSMLSTLALLMMLDDIAVLFNVTVEGHESLLKVAVFCAGYFNDSLIKNVLRVFRKK